jgi:hypothetical protein
MLLICSSFFLFRIFHHVPFYHVLFLTLKPFFTFQSLFFCPFFTSTKACGCQSSIRSMFHGS